MTYLYIAYLYNISVYDISLYDISVYDISVYDIAVYDIAVYDKDRAGWEDGMGGGGAGLITRTPYLGYGEQEPHT